jgi:membrane AbrB-like protein
MEFLLFFALCFIGGWLGLVLRLPAGALIGPLLLVGLFKLTNVLVISEIPMLILWASQASLGLFIGLMFSREILKFPKKMLVAVLLIGISSIFTSFLVGFFVYKTTNLSLIDAIISVVPGGLAEMLAFSNEINADTQSIAIFQLLRVVLLMLIVPNLITWIYKKINNKSSSEVKDQYI